MDWIADLMLVIWEKNRDLNKLEDINAALRARVAELEEEIKTLADRYGVLLRHDAAWHQRVIDLKTARVAELENGLETSLFDVKIAHEAILQLEAAQAWRPIEGAPKDTLVVVKFDPRKKLPPITAKLGVLVTMMWADGEETIYNFPKWMTSDGLQIDWPVAWPPIPEEPEEM